MALHVEPDLVEAARAPDGRAALERLVAAIWPEAYRIAAGILRDRVLAEDVAQEACASIVRALPKLADPQAFATWVYRVVTNHAMDAVRRRTRVRAAAEIDASDVACDASDGWTLDLHRALGRLPPAQRAAVVLHYYAGFTSAEIAGALGVPASTVRFRLMLARRALRAALDNPHDVEVYSHAR